MPPPVFVGYGNGDGFLEGIGLFRAVGNLAGNQNDFSVDFQNFAVDFRISVV